MPRRSALLVATYHYQDAGLRQLTAPAHDADALANVLRHPEIAGFDVTILINEPHHVVGRTIGDFYRNRRRDDLTFLYFTGHGLKDDEGRLYFAMTNTTRDDLLFTALPAQQIDYAMDSCSSQQNVLVLDCCYSGAFPAGYISKAGAEVHSLEKFQGRGRVVLTASDATQYSFEGNRIIGQGTRSVFTHFLVEGLSTGDADLDEDGDVSLDELYTYVYDHVIEEMPQQRPKKQENVEGRIVIARNIHWSLPVYLRNAVESPRESDRLASLDRLSELYRVGNDTVRTEVINHVRRLTDDTSKLVSAAAMARLLETLAHERTRWAVRRTISREAGRHIATETQVSSYFSLSDGWKHWSLGRLLGRRGMVLGALLLVLAVVTLIIFTAVVPGTGTAHGPVGAVVPGLERFYGQTLSWGDCSPFATTPVDQNSFANPTLQCAYLKVPLDYANPNGRVIKIGLLRRPASDPAHRIGSLVINPGGPGGSGMSTAAALAHQISNDELGRRFDFVGFDPRGVSSSEPQVICLTAAERDAERLMDLGTDTSPAGVVRTEDQERTDNARCVSRTGLDVLAHIGTREVARDMDVMRSTLGDEKLTYLGYSYGSRIGTSYAEAFPGNVRAMIFDGASDPAEDQSSQRIDQGRGYQEDFDAFAAWCTGRTDCALGQDKSQATSKFQVQVRPLITNPAAVSDGRKLSYTDATVGTVQALYLPALWSALNRGLQELAQDRGDTLIRLADVYYGRTKNGVYSSAMDTYQAVRCVDNTPIKDQNVARDVDARYRKIVPFLDTGESPSPALDNCAFWPVPPSNVPHYPQISGLPTVVVISTTRDTSTPYQDGINLALDLNARLLTFEGAQHTAFLQGNTCVDRAGIVYLATLQLPPEGTRCEPSS